jgi:hypothetical protein
MVLMPEGGCGVRSGQNSRALRLISIEISQRVLPRSDAATLSQHPYTLKMPGQRGPVPVPQPNGSRDLPTTVLETLEHTDPIQTSTTFPDVSQAEIKAAIDRLASRSMVEYDTTDSEIVVLTAEGKQIADEGSHEYKVWKVVKDSGRVSLKELPV